MFFYFFFFFFSNWFEIDFPESTDNKKWPNCTMGILKNTLKFNLKREGSICDFSE